MADKEKRIQIFLKRMGMKGKLKMVKTLQEACIVVVLDSNSTCNGSFFEKEGYQIALSRGETFPEDRVHFLKSTNPRNSQMVTRGLMTKTYGISEIPL